MHLALRLARRGYGTASPNPMVGAVLVKDGRIIGRGWHRRAGEPHAEIEAMRDAKKQGEICKGADLYVTLEPCSTHGRTPPCTEAIQREGIRRVIVGATDPNPNHAGRGFKLLRRARIEVIAGVLGQECEELNEAFNFWITNRKPLVTVKAAMTMDGKIATASGESKWITGEKARAYGMKLRQGADAILVGVNTILADDPSLTARNGKVQKHRLRRIVLDSKARTPSNAKIVSDELRQLTTVVVGKDAPDSQVKALEKKVHVMRAPTRAGRIDLGWLLRKLGKEEVTSLLVEGGGEVNGAFLSGRYAQRIAFFYAPKILGGRESKRAVAGGGATGLKDALELKNLEWRKFGDDLLLTAAIKSKRSE